VLNSSFVVAVCCCSVWKLNNELLPVTEDNPVVLIKLMSVATATADAAVDDNNTVDPLSSPFVVSAFQVELTDGGSVVESKLTEL